MSISAIASFQQLHRFSNCIVSAIASLKDKLTYRVLVVDRVDLDPLALLLDLLVGRRRPGPDSSRGVDEELTLSSLRTWEYYKCEAALLT
jgi:hypothetical protein